MNVRPHTIFLLLALISLPGSVRAERIPLNSSDVLASSSVKGQEASGAVDGDRFDFKTGHAWNGKAGESNWWWQVHFDKPHPIGAILQITGDHPFVLRHGMTDYVWRSSPDGKIWTDLVNIRNEQRTFRLHRFNEVRTATPPIPSHFPTGLSPSTPRTNPFCRAKDNSSFPWRSRVPVGRSCRRSKSGWAPSMRHLFEPNRGRCAPSCRAISKIGAKSAENRGAGLRRF